MTQVITPKTTSLQQPKQKELGQYDRRDGWDANHRVCLRSAKIVLNSDRDKNIKKSKDTKKWVVEKEIRHVHYKEPLLGKKHLTAWNEHAPQRRAWDLFGGGEQNLTQPFDSKRYVAENALTHLQVDTDWQP